MNIILVIGARPNFIKVAPLVKAISKFNNSHPSKNINYRLVHTGQHYDYEMSQVFFQDLEIPAPDIHLGIGSGTHAEQTGKIMMAFEKILLEQKPEMVIVFGDVNSTLAAALASAKLHIPVAHIEAGIRSYDMTMPEEINRRLTDHLSDYLFTTSKYDDANLKNEGIKSSKIYRVGNIMVDSLMSYLPLTGDSNILNKLSLVPKQYGLVTLHRASNVDNKNTITGIIQALEEISHHTKLIFPVHPRTRKNIEAFGILSGIKSTDENLKMIEPVGYLDFLKMESNASFVITDSGGIQVETTVLNIPCFTIMDKPVWKITHKSGTNILIGNDISKLIKEASNIINSQLRIVNHGKQITRSLPLWDGNTANRIVELITSNNYDTITRNL